VEKKKGRRVAVTCNIMARGHPRGEKDGPGENKKERGPICAFATKTTKWHLSPMGEKRGPRFNLEGLALGKHCQKRGKIRTQLSHPGVVIPLSRKRGSLSRRSTEKQGEGFIKNGGKRGWGDYYRAMITKMSAAEQATVKKTSTMAEDG